ncbi:MAG: energy transducer TonB [Pseudomonadota bacterium]
MQYDRIYSVATVGAFLAATLTPGCAIAQTENMLDHPGPSGTIVIPKDQPRFGFAASDPNRHVKLRRLPDPRPRPPATLLSPYDYPPAALREDRQGVSQLTFVVGADGRVSSCQATGGGGAPGPYSLDEESCRLITRRARFLPALDRHKRPVSATVHWAIEWKFSPGWKPRHIDIITP